MDDVLNELVSIENAIGSVDTYSLDPEVLVNLKSRLRALVLSSFNQNQLLLDTVQKISMDSGNVEAYRASLNNLKRVVSRLSKEYIISQSSPKLSDLEKKELFDDFTKLHLNEIKEIQENAKKLNEFQEKILADRKELDEQQAKFDEFKSKLEISNKILDFQSEAQINKKVAVRWAVLTGVLLVAFLIVLIASLNSKDSFSEIAKLVKVDMGTDPEKVDQLTISTIYFSYGKYLFTKILLYSLCIYAIVFCLKNYNAQMHNNIVNIHKSNALTSTLSLLDTAKSADGNDKLLVQATQAIFSHQHTGYNGNDTEPANPNLITNVIESVSKNLKIFYVSKQ